MYLTLRSHRDIENRQLKGYIVDVERLEKRSFLLHFYPSTKISEENYCPAFQHYFEIKNFFAEELFLEQKIFKTANKKKFLNRELLRLVQEPVVCFYQNFTVTFEEDLWKKYLNTRFILKEKIFFRKIFQRLEQHPWKQNLLINVFKFFSNKNLKKNLYTFKIFINFLLKKKIQLCLQNIYFKLFKKLKKLKKKIPLFFQKFSKTGLIFFFPGSFFFLKLSFSKLYNNSFEIKKQNFKKFCIKFQNLILTQSFFLLNFWQIKYYKKKLFFIFNLKKIFLNLKKKFIKSKNFLKRKNFKKKQNLIKKSFLFNKNTNSMKIRSVTVLKKKTSF